MKMTKETDGFRVTSSMTTNDSIVYKFKVKELPLPISHSCTDNLTMHATIYQNDVPIAQSKELSINANDPLHKFPFIPAATLKPGTTYQLEFKLINGYPTGCSFDDISFVHSNRRRMGDYEVFNVDATADAMACACTLGQSLAASPAMKSGVNAMCNEGLGDKRVKIEAGLFTQKCSQTALKNHLFATGSFYLYDEKGKETFQTDKWPSGNVKEPCIAVDEENNRIFAIGGYDESTEKAVDTIQVFEFDDDKLKDGKAVSYLDGWKLDQPRYGSMCYYWNEQLVVISGMAEKQYEFTDKSKFLGDIRLFPVPENANQLKLWLSACGHESYPKSSDDNGCASGTALVAKTGVIDSRPLIYDNHILYLFGGKTDVSSKNFVGSIDLNEIKDGAKAVHVMDIVKQKAQPLIDQVQYDHDGVIKSCYMVFAGSTYNGSQLINQTDKELTNNIQLFCNDNIKDRDSDRRRRRMNDEYDPNMPTITEFDREMLERGRRRRLHELTEEETEVFERDYTYGSDGIWYNFTVNFELCYDNNDLLKDAETYYDDVISSKPYGPEWIDYAVETSQDILQESLDAYYGWSNGFGDVSVWDLDKLSVNYDVTPAPTITTRCNVTSQNTYRRLVDFKEPHDVMMDASIDDKIRRLQGAYDITSGIDGRSPCITFEIQLETENLVPSNNDPDPVSNIMLIGEAIANITGGKVTLPIFPDPEEPTQGGTGTTDPESVTYDPFKDIVAKCGEDKTQITDSYWPKDTFEPRLDAYIKDEGNGFSITTSITTEDSIAYVFNIDELPLAIPHSCNAPIILDAAIYNDGDLVAQSKKVSINPNNDQLNKFEFSSTVSLKASTTYSIIFKLIDGYPTGCNFDDILNGYNSNNRRRMVDSSGYFSYDDFKADANPNACTLGSKVAKSPAMKTGVAAMCNPNLGDKRNDIEMGLFTQKCSQTALKNHLFKTGSLYLYDSNGVETFSKSDWPSGNVKEPCIAVDEDGRRIFAVGGYDNKTGKAVDTIQVFEFVDDTLKDGSAVTELNGWKLDKPRYGSMCFYWSQSATSKNLVVISGMDDKQYEFTDKSKFFNDIRIFPIPASKSMLDLCTKSCGGKSCSNPSDDKTGCPSSTKFVAKKGLIDSRPFLYDNHKLYLFGGKTHLESKNFVTYFDLNNINNDNAAEKELLTLVKEKAQPLIDEVKINCGDDHNPNIITCYMAMMGQTYENGKAIPSDTELPNNLQLFCNDAIEQPEFVGNRRRLKKTDNNIPTLSEYDRLMLEKGRRRRRLFANMSKQQEPTEIMIRNFKFGLDGLWYDFSVKFELCYENNEKLKEAEIKYKNVLFSKPDGQEWIDYAQETSSDILDVSLDAYYGWSNGFGAVNVLDLNILNINYNHVQKTQININHPERRNARFWNHNIEDKGNDFIWIDEKINCKNDD